MSLLPRKIEVEVIADHSRYTKGLNDASDSTGRFGSKLKSVAKIAGVAGVAIGGAVVVGLTKSVQAAMEAEQAQARLQQALESANISYAKHGAAIEDAIQKTSRLAAIDDEDLSDAFAKLVRSTGDVTKATEGMALAADIARARNISLEAATKMVEKAQIGQETAFTRIGIRLKENQDATDALTIAQERFGGAAEKYGNTAAGAQEKLGVAFENLQEKVGQKVLPMFTSFLLKLNELVAWAEANWPKFEKAIVEHSRPVVEIFNRIKAFIIDQLVPAFTRFAQEIVIPYMRAIGEVFEKHGPEIQRILGRIAAVVEVLGKTWLWLAENIVIPIIKPLFTTIIPAALTVAIVAIDKMTGAIEAVITAMKWIGVNAARLWDKFAGAMERPAQVIVSALQPVVDVLNSIIRAISHIIFLADKIGDAAGRLASAMSAIGGAVGKIPGFAQGVTGFEGGLAVVGERGPELVRLPRGSDVIPIKPGGLGLQATGGGNVYVTVNAPNYVGTLQELQRVIQEAAADFRRRNGGSLL